jgi:hypothetical protein
VPFSRNILVGVTKAVADVHSIDASISKEVENCMIAVMVMVLIVYSHSTTYHNKPLLALLCNRHDDGGVHGEYSCMLFCNSSFRIEVTTP